MTTPILTVQEFLSLPQREQDAYATEHIRGWVWRLAPRGCRFLCPPWEEDSKLPEAEGHEQMCRDAYRFVVTSLVASWAGFGIVVEHMQSLGYEYDLWDHHKSTDFGPYRVSFYINRTCEPTDFDANTPFLAAVVAALLALGKLRRGDQR